jgi:hypothetical protein
MKNKKTEIDREKSGQREKWIDREMDRERNG